MLYVADMYATGLLGGYVRQKEMWDSVKGDCFSACISMLTGIDLELLPVLPPAAYTSTDLWTGWMHIEKDENTWGAWRDLLADNGYHFSLTDLDPTEPYILCLLDPQGIGHAVVINRGLVLNPAHPDEVVRRDEVGGWIEFTKVTVTPL